MLGKMLPQGKAGPSPEERKAQDLVPSLHPSLTLPLDWWTQINPFCFSINPFYPTLHFHLPITLSLEVPVFSGLI